MQQYKHKAKQEKRNTLVIEHIEAAMSKTLTSDTTLTIPATYTKTRSTFHLVVDDLVNTNVKDMTQMMHWNINFTNFTKFEEKQHPIIIYTTLMILKAL